MKGIKYIYFQNESGKVCLVRPCDCNWHSVTAEMIFAQGPSSICGMRLDVFATVGGTYSSCSAASGRLIDDDRRLIFMKSFHFMSWLEITRRGVITIGKVNFL